MRIHCLPLGLALLAATTSAQDNSTHKTSADQAASRAALVSGHVELAPDLVDVAVGAGDFNTLVAAVQAAGLVEALKGKGPFTIFAPTDAAFASLPAGVLQELLLPENRQRLTEILTYHVVPGRVFADQAVAARSALPCRVTRWASRVLDGRLSVNGASAVVASDIETSNGVIHVIDSVLLP
jgi:transforming growth factor-beta-induced protein